jgi:hypothetical protein
LGFFWGFSPSHLDAQILLDGSAYRQEFNTLAATGTAVSWVDNVTLPGWYAGNSGTSFGDYRAGTGSATTGDLYSFGSSGSADRALGSLATDSLGLLAYGVRLKNDGATALSGFAVTYAGEQWRNSGGGAQSLSFSYLISDEPITSVDAKGLNAWISVPALDFVSPQNGGTAAALDGNADGNRRLLSDVPLTGLVLDPGRELFLRWADANDVGSDHGLGIDDLSVRYSPNYSPVPEPGDFKLVAALGLVLFGLYQRRCGSSQRATA